MRSILIFLLCNCLLAKLFSQTNPVLIVGTAMIDSKSSLDVTEVTIQEYSFFLVNHQFDSSLFPNIKKLPPAARIYFQDLLKGYGSSFITVVKNHPVMESSYGVNGFVVTKAYRKFEQEDSTGFSILNPIVAVSFNQAQKFCAWREDNENKNRKVKIRITLPPPTVYQTLISRTDSLKAGNNDCGRYEFNYAHPPCKMKYKFRDMSQQGVGLVRADRFKPTMGKFYNLTGNAAEMTSEKGVAGGGSFLHSAQEAMGTGMQEYIEEENWLGFRCYILLQENFFRKFSD